VKRTTEDGWDAGETYELFMGRWSRLVASEFVRWLEPPPCWHWLDVGTGTGALAEAVCARADPASVTACDPSEPFVESARRALPDPRVTFEVAGVGSLPSREGGYDAVVSGLALNFFADPDSALDEQLAGVRVGGLVGAYVWDYADGMEFLRHFWDAAVRIVPRAAELDESDRFPLCEPRALEQHFESAGAVGVRVEALTVRTIFSSFDDYWRPFLGSVGPAPQLVSSLTPDQREEVREALRRRLPRREDGAIVMRARAWAVVGARG
jgi:SAM-dependent methyltransferase